MFEIRNAIMQDMPPAPVPAHANADSFEPHKRTLGELLASTSPPLRVPDFQRDYSWGKDETADFWKDIVDFGGNNPKQKPVGQYFLGATVLVDNGTFHLVLDGQQRLATATILLAAIRDKIAEYKADAAQQLQNQFLVFTDELTGEKVTRLELNAFDRGFFRDLIQRFPRDQTAPAISLKSHSLIADAYTYFSEKISEGWEAAGGGLQGFEWAGHIAIVVRQNLVLITVVSTNERSAASIFTALNDRGIGLSTVDLVRSDVLQRAHATQREEILSNWEAVFKACGTEINAEALMRISWVSQKGDQKTRALQKVISDDLDKKGAVEGPLAYARRLKEDALLYRKLRDGDTDDPDLEEYWLGLRHLKFNAGYALLIAAAHTLTAEDQKSLAKALGVLVLRHNTVCHLDRASLESLAFSCAKDLSDGKTLADVLGRLRQISPDDDLFVRNFLKLSFSPSEHGLARYLLTLFDGKLATTQEVTVAGSDRVHVEHIYPQTPEPDAKWQDHDVYVKRLGNLTLLDKKLNTQIKNADFPIKKEKAYQDSRLEVTKELLKYDDWSAARVDERQAELMTLALELWPANLIAI